MRGCCRTASAKHRPARYRQRLAQPTPPSSPLRAAWTPWPAPRPDCGPWPCHGFLHSAAILADACARFREFCIEGTELNRAQVDSYVGRSLMLVTALSPVIGYDKAAAIAHKASDEGTTLREAVLATGYVSAADFDRIVVPHDMVGLPGTGAK